MTESHQDKKASNLNSSLLPAAPDARQRAEGARASDVGGEVKKKGSAGRQGPASDHLPGDAVTEEGEVAWLAMREGLRRKLSDGAYRSWIERLQLVSATSTCLTIEAPNRYMRDRIEIQYAYDMVELAGRAIRLVVRRPVSTGTSDG